MNEADKTGDYQPGAAESPTVVVADVLPPFIGRYRVQRVLGKGGFGLVYLAHEEQPTYSGPNATACDKR